MEIMIRVKGCYELRSEGTHDPCHVCFYGGPVLFYVGIVLQNI